MKQQQQEPIDEEETRQLKELANILADAFWDWCDEEDEKEKGKK